MTQFDQGLQCGFRAAAHDHRLLPARAREILRTAAAQAARETQGTREREDIIDTAIRSVMRDYPAHFCNAAIATL